LFLSHFSLSCCAIEAVVILQPRFLFFSSTGPQPPRTLFDARAEELGKRRIRLLSSIPPSPNFPVTFDQTSSLRTGLNQKVPPGMLTPPTVFE